MWHEYHFDLCLSNLKFPIEMIFLPNRLPIEFADRRGRKKQKRTSARYGDATFSNTLLRCQVCCERLIVIACRV